MAVSETATGKDGWDKLSIISTVLSGIFVPALVFYFGQEFTSQKEAGEKTRAEQQLKADLNQRAADRISLLLNSLASENPTERRLALEVANYLAQNNQLPQELAPVIEYLVNPNEFEFGISDSAVPEADRRAISALRSQPGMVTNDSFWIYVGDLSPKKAGLSKSLFEASKSGTGRDTMYATAEVYERLDLPRSNKNKWFKGKICGFLYSGQKVAVKRYDTLLSTHVWAHVKMIPPSPKDYRVHIYGYKIDWQDFHKAAGSIAANDYSIIDKQMLQVRENFLSDSSAVFFYSTEVMEEARNISALLENLFNKKFPVKVGRGYGLPQGKERWSIYVHLIK